MNLKHHTKQMNYFSQQWRLPKKHCAIKLLPANELQLHISCPRLLFILLLAACWLFILLYISPSFYLLYQRNYNYWAF